MIYIHADDFGLDLETTLETMRLIDLGAINSVSIMAHSEHLELISSFLKDKNIRIGVHFNIVDGYKRFNNNFSKYRREYFYRSNIVRGLSILHLLDVDSIVEELKLQVDEIKRYGILIDHIDSHGHLHKFPVISSGVIKYISEYGFNYKIRIAQNVFLESRKVLTNRLNASFNKRLIEHGVNYGDYFYMPSQGFKVAEIVSLACEFVKNNSELIIGIHPGSVHRWNLDESRLCEILYSNIHG
jgi:predicted glycoside hydrolase/deacetylase ChbG (UPF0249 family)